jgi:hypothetical protein
VLISFSQTAMQILDCMRFCRWWLRVANDPQLRPVFLFREAIVPIDFNYRIPAMPLPTDSHHRSIAWLQQLLEQVLSRSQVSASEIVGITQLFGFQDDMEPCPSLLNTTLHLSINVPQNHRHLTLRMRNLRVVRKYKRCHNADALFLLVAKPVECAKAR